MAEKRFEIDLDEEAITDNGEFCLSLYCFQDKGERDVCDLLNTLNNEIEYFKKRLNDVERELFCKDRLLEENGIDIECCDKK